jgi:hypothetical protein
MIVFTSRIILRASRAIQVFVMKGTLAPTSTGIVPVPGIWKAATELTVSGHRAGKGRVKEGFAPGAGLAAVDSDGHAAPPHGLRAGEGW